MLKSLRSVAILAIVAACSFAVAAVHTIGSVATSVWEYGRDLARGILAGPVPMATHAELRPQVQRVQAQAFAAGIVKRERPRVFSTWRMCPSI